MERGVDPVSSSRLAGLTIIVAVGATVATLGLIFSDPGDDASRVAYLVSLAAATGAALLLPMLLHRRRVEITRLRGDAAVLIFQLRTHATGLAQSSRWPREQLAEALRTATALTFMARTLVETLTRAGASQEAIELRVAMEAIEASLELAGES
jgi:hypothetical protein